MCLIHKHEGNDGLPKTPLSYTSSLNLCLGPFKNDIGRVDNISFIIGGDITFFVSFLAARCSGKPVIYCFSPSVARPKFARCKFSRDLREQPNLAEGLILL